MEIMKLIADTIVDIISEKDIGEKRNKKKNFKKGFFFERPYLISRTTLKSEKMLITEEYLIGLMEQGKRNIKIPENSIITPLARMLIDENKISVF